MIRFLAKLLLIACLFGSFVCAGQIRNPRGAEDIFPCYAPQGRTCKIVNYASSSAMPMDGELEFVGERADCFFGDGKAFIMFQSNAPEQIRDSVFWNSTSRCHDDGWNCGNLEGVELPRWTEKSGLYFHSCKNTEATAKGCKPVKQGLEVIVNNQGKMEKLSREALFYYFDVKLNKGMDKFLTWVEKNPGPEKIEIGLPWGLKDEDAVLAGNRFAPKLTKMNFYLRSKKIESKTYKPGQFDSLEKLMGACREWGLKHENP